MSNDNQNICLYYGLCCNGILFDHANIKENETIATGFSFEIIKREKRAFKLPGTYLNEKVSSIYVARPYFVCEAFQCKLPKAFRTGNISFDDAMKIIIDEIVQKTKIEHQLLEYHPENKGESLHGKMKEFNEYYAGTIQTGKNSEKSTEKMVLDYYMSNKIVQNKFKNDETRADISGQ